MPVVWGEKEMNPGSFFITRCTGCSISYCSRAVVLLGRKRNEWAILFFKILYKDSLAQAHKGSFRIPEQFESLKKKGNKSSPLHAGGKNSGFWNQNSHLCNLIPIHLVLSTEGRGWTLWSYEEANAALGYTVFAFQLRGSEMSGVVSASVPIHSHCRAAAQLTIIPNRGSGQMEGIYKAVSWSCKNKCWVRQTHKKTGVGVWNQICILVCLY